MFYILSRFFACTASPLFYIIVLLFWALFTKSKVKKIVLATISAVLIILVTNVRLFNIAAQAWSTNCIIDVDTTKHYDYAILPGGMTDLDTLRNRVEYYEASDRIIDCVWLMKIGVVDTMIITGDGSSNRPMHNHIFLKHMQEVYGISADRIIIETKAQNTIENFTKTIELVGSQIKENRVLVVNSAFYMRRTMLCCQKVGLDCDFYTVDLNTSPRSQWESWVPDFTLFCNWTKLIHEWIGYVAYIFY